MWRHRSGLETARPAAITEIGLDLDLNQAHNRTVARVSMSGSDKEQETNAGRPSRLVKRKINYELFNEFGKNLTPRSRSSSEGDCVDRITFRVLHTSTPLVRETPLNT